MAILRLKTTMRADLGGGRPAVPVADADNNNRVG